MSRQRDPYLFGKAVAGGTPLSAEEMALSVSNQIAEMKERLARPAPTLTEDPLMLRLAEELDYAHRLLEGVEAEMERRAALGDGPLRRQVSEADRIVTDVAEIIAAGDRRAAIASVRSDDMRRRLLRSSLFVDISGNDELPVSKS